MFTTAGLHVANIDVAADRHRFKKTSSLRFFGHVDNAVADRWLRLPDSARGIKLDLAAVKHVALDHAGYDFGGLVATRADEAEHSGDLAGKDREGCSDHRAHREPETAPVSAAAPRHHRTLQSTCATPPAARS